ncbi:MAG: hypothetical protein Q9187_000937 [Circinaria calcarea]
MAAHLSWLATCKASQLRAVAVATGVNSGGTKPILTSRLFDALQQDKLDPPDKIYDGNFKQHRIISIDMGIRNLAYCRLALPSHWPGPCNSLSTLPVVEAWDRVAVAQRSDPKIPSLDEAPCLDIKETFDPLTYSEHAYSLLKNLLFSSSHPAPTQILIERQRFRSMGGSAVQEWTLRVNMFEAMLYAVLKTLHSEGKWQGNVYPVAPSKVSNFWLGDREGTRKGKGNGKGEKIDLVNGWLNDKKQKFELRDGALETACSWRTKQSDVKAKRRNEGRVKMGKLDDLADCLLQGLAWINWEQNKRTLVRDGLVALENI